MLQDAGYRQIDEPGAYSVYLGRPFRYQFRTYLPRAVAVAENGMVGWAGTRGRGGYEGEPADEAVTNLEHRLQLMRGLKHDKARYLAEKQGKLLESLKGRIARVRRRAP